MKAKKLWTGPFFCQPNCGYVQEKEMSEQSKEVEIDLLEWFPLYSDPKKM